MQIVDNSPEMDPTSPEFAAKLAELSAKKEPQEEKGEQEKAEKDTKAAKEPAKESPSTEKDDEGDEGDLDARVKALKRELKRVRDSKREDEDRVAKLQDEISSLKTEMQKAKAAPAGDEKGRIQEALDKLSEEQIENQLVDWTDELADARARLTQAEDKGDEAKIEQAKARIAKARIVLAMAKETLKQKSKLAFDQKAGAEAEKSEIAKEIDGIFKVYIENFPELEDKDSKLWIAGNEMYNKHPALMKRLGPIGQLVAVSLAVSADPKLVGKDASKVRKDLLHNIEEAAQKSLVTGGKGGGKGKAPVVDVNNLDAFEAYIEKIKSGG